MTEAFVNVRFARSQVERLDVLAEVQGASRSDVIRSLVMEASMTPEERSSVPDERELLLLLGEKARAGNVTAMKALLEEHRRDGGDEPPSEFDELDGSIIDQLAKRRTNGNAKRAA